MFSLKKIIEISAFSVNYRQSPPSNWCPCSSASRSSFAKGIGGHKGTGNYYFYLFWHLGLDTLSVFVTITYFSFLKAYLFLACRIWEVHWRTNQWTWLLLRTFALHWRTLQRTWRRCFSSSISNTRNPLQEGKNAWLCLYGVQSFTDDAQCALTDLSSIYANYFRMGKKTTKKIFLLTNNRMVPSRWTRMAAQMM